MVTLVTLAPFWGRNDLFTRYQCLLPLPSCLAARRPPPPRGPAPPIPPLPQDVGASDELTLRQAKLGEGGGWCSIGVEVGPACIVRRKCQQRDELILSGNRGQWVHTSGAVWVVVGWRWCRTGWVRRRTDRNGDVLVRVFRYQAKLSFSRASRSCGLFRMQLRN